jgi:hypothetical protein
MEQKDKELLLKDLCARLPYGVRVWYKYSTWHSEKFATSIRLVDEKIALSSKFNKEGDWFPIEEAGEILIKPYLRPLSSMTEEECKELKKLMNCDYVTDCSLGYTVGGQVDYDDFLVYYEESSKLIDWLNKNMFDYRGLIPKGFAIEAPEGMYNS